MVPAARQDAARRTGHAGAVVTIVEDDDEFRDALAALLASGGHADLAPSAGQQALARLEQGRRSDALFLDLWKLVMNGRELLEAPSSSAALSVIPRVPPSAARGQQQQRGRGTDETSALRAGARGVWAQRRLVRNTAK